MEISWALPVTASKIYPSLIPRFLSKEQSMGNRNEMLPYHVTLFEHSLPPHLGEPVYYTNGEKEGRGTLFLPSVLHVPMGDKSVECGGSECSNSVSSSPIRMRP